MSAKQGMSEQYGWGAGESGDAPTVKLPVQRTRGKRIKRAIFIGLGSIFGFFVVLVIIGVAIGPQPPRTSAAPVPAPVPVVSAAPVLPPVAPPAPPAAPLIAPAPALAPAAAAAPASTAAAAPATRAAVGTPKPKPKPAPRPAAPKPVAKPAATKAAPAPAASSGGAGLCVKKDENGRWRDAKGRFCSPG